MSDDLLRKYLRSVDEPEPDEPSFIRGENPVRLEIREANGNSRSFPYSSLEYIDFNPSEGLTLAFSTCEVELKGQNLGRLYEALNSHAVKCVLVAPGKSAEEDDGAKAKGPTIVEACKVESV